MQLCKRVAASDPMLDPKRGMELTNTYLRPLMVRSHFAGRRNRSFDEQTERIAKKIGMDMVENRVK